MPDEIIKQGPGFTIYRTTDWGPPVPYPSVKHVDSTNHGFIDLRDRPDLAMLIPEARDNPGLQAILIAANAAGSPFMTLGCECRIVQLEATRADGLVCYKRSYTDITFRDPARHSAEHQLVSLAEQLLSHLRITEPIALDFELGVQRMKSFFGFTTGYCLEFALSAFGTSEAEAVSSYEIVARAAASAISASANASST